MRARLFAKTGTFTGASFRLEGEATFGRSADNAVVLDDAAVSARHGRIFWDADEECFWIEDRGSRNGTWVGGIRVGTEPEKLGDLDVVGVAGVGDLVFHVVTGAEPEAPAAEAGEEAPGRATFADAEPLAVPAGIAAAGKLTDEAPRTLSEDADDGWVLPPSDEPLDPVPAASGGTMLDADFLPVPDLAGGTGRDVPGPLEEAAAAPVPRSRAEQGATLDTEYWLEVFGLDGELVRHRLPAGEHLVGRGLEADVVVDDPTLSRSHVRLRVGDAGVELIDLRSTNGTRVGGEEVPADTSVPVPSGTEVELGSVRCRIVRATANAPEAGRS